MSPLSKSSPGRSARDAATLEANDSGGPAQRLRRIAALAAASLGEDGAWLAEAIRARLAGEARTLDAALGFSRRGGASPDVQARNARRNAILREFAARFLGDMTPRDQARALLAELDRFKTRGEWSRLAAREECPHHLVGTRQELLFQLLKIGRLPGLRQMLGVLAQEIQSGGLDFHDRPTSSAKLNRSRTCCP